MNILAVLSRKGGTGKTTLTVNLAIAAELVGHKVAIVDLDSQASASEWGDWREAEIPEVISVHYFCHFGFQSPVDIACVAEHPVG